MYTDHWNLSRKKRKVVTILPPEAKALVVILSLYPVWSRQGVVYSIPCRDCNDTLEKRKEVWKPVRKNIKRT